jgi:hypothetical protein
MSEYWVHRSLSIHATRGVVHLELEISDWDEEGRTINIEYDARELLSDIPALYRFCKNAIQQEEKHEANKYREFKDLLSADLKKPVGRPKK